MTRDISTNWLSLGEAAKVLGVHPSTVRSWSNQGILPVQRTKGGHRRYRRNEIELWMESQRSQSSSGVDLVIQYALRNTRFQISEGRLESEAWYKKLDEKARRQYRESGRALLQGLISYISADEANAAAEAEAVGYEYASRGRRHGLDDVEATHAFLFFRNMLMEAMLSVYESAAVRSPTAWSDMFRRINAFTDQILVTILKNYEAYRRGSKGAGERGKRGEGAQGDGG
jgi:excisionase family DNA binding protein